MNFYEYLDLPTTATPAEIKKAFRTKAKKTHPDYNRKSTAFYEMVELNLIHDTLLDPHRRAQYDAALSQGQGGVLHPHQTTRHKPAPKLHKLYRAVRELFIYRCRICSLEMSSTWQGYCLYHYLEVSGQLHNADYSFTYKGYTFHWQPPQQTKASTTTHTLPTKSELIFFISSIFIILLVLYWLVVTRW